MAVQWRSTRAGGRPAPSGDEVHPGRPSIGPGGDEPDEVPSRVPHRTLARMLGGVTGRLRGLGVFLASLVVLLTVWQWATATDRVSSIILPEPTDIFSELVFFGENFFSGVEYWRHTWVTLQEVLLGFGIAAGAAFVLGTLVSEFRVVREVVLPYAVALNATPKVAFVPVFIVWLGFGIAPKVLVAALIAFFPVFVNTIAGMGALQLEQIELMRSLRASRWQMFKHLKLFNSLPFVFAGLKTGMVLSVIGAIVAEFGGASEGLGFLIKLSSSRLRADQVFAYIAVLSLMGYALFAAINAIERRVLFWARHTDAATATSPGG